MRSRNRTKMFHVKRFGTIRGLDGTKSAYVLWLGLSAIARNKCKFGGRPLRHSLLFRPAPGGGTLDARFIRAYCPVMEPGLTGAAAHIVDEQVAVADIEALTEIYAAILEDYFH
jgi:hypothetical protein